jgi:hypothetical protein
MKKKGNKIIEILIKINSKAPSKQNKAPTWRACLRIIFHQPPRRRSDSIFLVSDATIYAPANIACIV